MAVSFAVGNEDGMAYIKVYPEPRPRPNALTAGVYIAVREYNGELEISIQRPSDLTLNPLPKEMPIRVITAFLP
jgi:hypothetical protein